MPQIFGHAAQVPAGWDDRSIYTFALEGDPKAQFATNLVVVREPARGRDLATYVAEMRRKLADAMPGATFVREAKAKAGALAAVEHQYRLLPLHPLPGLLQLHTSILRDGFLYDFCLSATQHDFERDRKAAKAIVDSWASAPA